MTMTVSKDALCQKFAIVTGSTVDTDLTLTGIATEDTIVSCVSFAVPGTTAPPIDRTTTMTISGANAVQSSTATASMELHVHWLDNSA